MAFEVKENELPGLDPQGLPTSWWPMPEEDGELQGAACGYYINDQDLVPVEVTAPMTLVTLEVYLQVQSDPGPEVYPVSSLALADQSWVSYLSYSQGEEASPDPLLGLGENFCIGKEPTPEMYGPYIDPLCPLPVLVLYDSSTEMPLSTQAVPENPPTAETQVSDFVTRVKTEAVSGAPQLQRADHLRKTWIKDEVVPEDDLPTKMPQGLKRGRHRKQLRCQCSVCLHPERLPVGSLKFHACDYEGCSRTYKKTSHLRAHLLLHLGLRPFKCTFGSCQKGFTRSDELARHTRTHTKVRTHLCHLCHMTFSRSDHLSKHLKSHERKENLLKDRSKLCSTNPSPDPEKLAL